MKSHVPEQEGLLELLETVVNHELSRIRELAHLVDRHLPEVTENINELVDYGLVDLTADSTSTYSNN